MTCGREVRIYEHKGVPFVHISTFAVLTQHNVTTVRNMMVRSLEDSKNAEGGALKRRPLRYFRDGTTVWIPVKEVEGYPFVKGTNVYHYDTAGNRYLCQTCTFTNDVCEKNREAMEMELPVGDL